MFRIWIIHRLIPISVSLMLSSCAYFNTFYNAERYFKEADLLRLEKSDKGIPLRAIDNYGKTIQKCKVVLSDYPESKYVNDAILLMAKAQFYRSEYDNAILNLKLIFDKGSEDQIAEAKYWSAVCKWKKGKTQTAIDELELIIDGSLKNDLVAQSHLSLADIFLELNRKDDFLFHLEEGAKVIKERGKKGIVYNQLAEIAFNNENYSVAESAYKEVIKNSLTKEKIENAHIQILKISRILGDHRSVERKIKSMLVDEKFKNIKGDLELELAQLYIDQNDVDNSVVRLESIVNDYPRTETSAEAYYLLGQLYLSELWNPSIAKEKFSQVKKEYNRTEYGPFCDSKIKAIDKYIDALASLKKYDVKLDTLSNDSTKLDSTRIVDEIPKKPIQEILYLIGDIEAFSFERADSGIVYFERILEEDSSSQYYPKALFTLSMIFAEMADSSKLDYYSSFLKTKFPASDYTSYLFDNENIDSSLRPVEQLFSDAEKMWKQNPLSSLKQFKKVIQADSLSELSVSAAYFLGYQYDYKYAELDSAAKYYAWISSKHPNSEQNNIAKMRVQVIQNMLSTLKNDSTLTIN